VPPIPGRYPFAWIVSVLEIGEEDLLRMVGLDGYMLIRYINVCFRMSVFYTIFGLLVLVPVYSSAPGEHVSWNKYTLANIPNDPSANQLWVPAIFAYIFSLYFCHLMYMEYKNFVKKRLQYLISGDPDTPQQTYYTIMLEKVPITLRSKPALELFFENLFPGDVYSVDLALDLNELDALTSQRRNVRDMLEKSIAIWKATGNRPTKWVKKDFYVGSPDRQLPVSDSHLATLLNYEILDAISHFTKVLEMLNVSVRTLQITTFEQRQKVDEQESARQQNIHGKFEEHATQLAEKYLSGKRETLQENFDSVTSKITSIFNSVGSGLGQPIRESAVEIGVQGIQSDHSSNESNKNTSSIKNTKNINNKLVSEYDETNKTIPLLEEDSLTPMHAAEASSVPIMEKLTKSGGSLNNLTIIATEVTDRKRSKSACDEISNILPFHKKEKREKDARETGKGRKRSFLEFGKVLGEGVGGLAAEGVKTASIGIRGAMRGVLEGIRAVELLTVGAYYKTSSTAFVTLKSRVAKCSIQQMFLSHTHYSMVVKSAPNPKDCIWDNISIPSRQISIRRAIADGTLIVGAVFWSLVVGFIAAISNLESISKELPWLNNYRNTLAYEFLNDYLAVALLLVLLSLLPIIFDLIARSYEGLKLESEIQNSIMTRYFYYQLANVFVSVGLGSIASSIHQVRIRVRVMVSLITIN
jgi:hypothetical protein